MSVYFPKRAHELPSKENVRTGFSSRTLGNYLMTKSTAQLQIIKSLKSYFGISIDVSLLLRESRIVKIQDVTKTISHREGSLHSAVTYGNLLRRDLKRIKTFPPHMTPGSYSRSINVVSKTPHNLTRQSKTRPCKICSLYPTVARICALVPLLMNSHCDTLGSRLPITDCVNVTSIN